MGEFRADAAFIKFSFLEEHLLLDQRAVNLWKLTYTFDRDPYREHFWYNYSLFTKGSISKIPVLGRFLSKNPSQYKEIGRRSIESPVHHDVFHFISDTKYFSETISESVLFYVNWLLPYVNKTSIEEYLSQVERMKFSNLNMKAVRSCVGWILEQAVDYSVNDVQRLYLCIILGHLAANYTSRQLLLPNEHKTKVACDRLLQCLEVCPFSELLSSSSLVLLEKIAAILVDNSSNPGWLTFAAHFYPYIGVKNVRVRMTSAKCDQKEYRKMVNLLLSHLRMDDHENVAEEMVDRKMLLKKVLEAAPDQDVILELFENASLKPLFSSDEDKEDFFVNFYQDSARVERQAGGKNANPGKRLLELTKIPDKLLGKMHRLVYSSLLQFAKSTDELKEKHVEAFCHLIVSKQHSKYTLSTDQISTVLLELSKSKSMQYHSLLLVLLSNEDFDSDWHKMSFSQKVSTCSSWIVSKVVHDTKSQFENAGRTTIVYGAIEQLMSCSLNVSNKSLAVGVCADAIEKLFRNEETGSILKAHQNIEKLSVIIQECYIDHVKGILKREPHLIRNSSKILMQYPHSR